MFDSDFNSEAYLDMQLLRFTTAGSVDDGKSTLIGRLLYDSKSIFEDQLEAVERDSLRRGNEQINLALLTDGLRAEREQGITIDVAYRYFATPKRKFIIADTPGHIQYTRNMVTGASTANLAIILIDARQGVLEQTLRHSYIASLLQIPHLVICINKMDLVGYDQNIFESIRETYLKVSNNLDIKDIQFIPISALLGDNVVNPSEKTPWYQGPTLLQLLENIDITADRNISDPRFPVQYVIRPVSDEFHDYRGYAGRVAGGQFHTKDEVMVLPGRQLSRIASIDLFEKSINEAINSQSVTIRLEDDIDISRGDMIVSPDRLPEVSQEIDMMVCWFNEKPLNPAGKYAIRHTSREARCLIREICYKMDINSLTRNDQDRTIGMNDIGKIRIKTTKPLFYDAYNRNRLTGSLILIDEATHETVAAGMIL
ncbi:MAG: GTP-binding protein [Bacteroidales bacterium]|nr:GTP-binding protein [Bacteroidales bacterium]MDD4811807.1 GTP-binding protein [Bacteroidales bacterium]